MDLADGEKTKPKKNIGKLLHSLIKFIIFVGGKTYHAYQPNGHEPDKEKHIFKFNNLIINSL